jgi:cysteinyl-tRNA synthetase
LLDRVDSAPAAAVTAFDGMSAVLQVAPAGQLVLQVGPVVVQPGSGSLDITTHEPKILNEPFVEAEARRLAEERQRHRAARDWAKADEVRKLLLEKGFDVRDTKDGGYELRRLSSPPFTG